MNKPLTLTDIEMAIEHLQVLVLTGDTRTAAVLEQDLLARFLEATAKGLCSNPIEAAQKLLKLKELSFPRNHPKACNCTRHRLDAILGPVDEAEDGA